MVGLVGNEFVCRLRSVMSQAAVVPFFLFGVAATDA